MSPLRSRRCSSAVPPGTAVRRSLAAVLLLAITGIAVAGDAVAPKGAIAADRGGATVASTVAGIVSYTRWPGEMPTIRLCTVGKGRGVDELLSCPDLGAGTQSVPVRAASDAAGATSDCDAIYVGTLAADAARRLLQRSVGRPVLLIGEGADFCTDGGMFCLQPDAPSVRFGVNLDAVARSGLKVNPRVLYIARQARGGTP